MCFISEQQKLRAKELWTKAASQAGISDPPFFQCCYWKQSSAVLKDTENWCWCTFATGYEDRSSGPCLLIPTSPKLTLKQPLFCFRLYRFQACGIVERFGLEGAFRGHLAHHPLQWAGTSSTGPGRLDPAAASTTAGSHRAGARPAQDHDSQEPDHAFLFKPRAHTAAAVYFGSSRGSLMKKQAMTQQMCSQESKLTTQGIHHAAKAWSHLFVQKVVI